MKTIKKGLSNFLKGLKYYLTPFGATLLFFIIGLCIAIPAMVASVNSMLNDLSKTLGGMKFDWNAALDSIIGSIVKLDWGKDFSASLNKLWNADFLTNTLKDATSAAFGKIDYTKIILDIISNCVATIIGLIIVVIVLTILGLIFGFILTKMMLRHEVASVGKSFGKYMLRAALGAVVFTGLVMLITWVLSLTNSVLIWLAVVAIFIVYTFATILKDYLVYALKKVPLKKVLNPVNVLWLYLADIIVVAISVVSILLLSLIFGKAIAIVLAIPLAMIVVVTIDINTDSYVIEQIGEQPKKIKEKKVKEKAA